MTYVNAVKYINARGGIPSPERMRLLCRYLCDPQRQLRFVHIAGGSGKTSCAVMLSGIISEAGYTVGRLISPGVLELRERICIGGRAIPHNEFAEYVRQVSCAAAQMREDVLAAVAATAGAEQPSDGASHHKITKNMLEGRIPPDPNPDEVICAAAFLAFRENHCDLAVLECGASRADPTGVIDPPLVSVVCGSVLDSEQLRTGCGIIRRGTREVINCALGGESYNTISDICVRTGSRMTVPARGELNMLSSGLSGRVFEYRGKVYSVPFCAEYQMTNALAAIESVYALRRTGITLHSADVGEGISKVRVPLRFELISSDPTIIIDCARTESDAAALLDSMAKIRRFVGSRLHLILPEGYMSSISDSESLLLSGYEPVERISVGAVTSPKAAAATLKGYAPNDTMLVVGPPDFAGVMKGEITRALAYR